MPFTQLHEGQFITDSESICDRRRDGTAQFLPGTHRRFSQNSRSRWSQLALARGCSLLHLIVDCEARSTTNSPVVWSWRIDAVPDFHGAKVRELNSTRMCDLPRSVDDPTGSGRRQLHSRRKVVPPPRYLPRSAGQAGPQGLDARWRKCGLHWRIASR
jgi:hypothetical protein